VSNLQLWSQITNAHTTAMNATGRPRVRRQIPLKKHRQSGDAR
jgi:hypothetical protein